MNARLAMAAAVLVSSVALAGPCPTRPSWPTQGWPSSVEETKRARATELAALESFAFTLTGKDPERLGLRTEGLVIIKQGRLIYERYARGFGPDTRHLSWSVAKSVSSTLVGAAVARGALSLSDSICASLTEFEGSAVCAMTVKDVLTFGSGLAWQEVYEDETHQSSSVLDLLFAGSGSGSYQTSSVIELLFGSGHRDHLAHILGHKVAAAPGTRWLYSTADAELAAAVAKRALQKANASDDFWSVLFDRLGMGVTFEEDAKGTPNGGSHVFASPRDFAKLGWLMLNDGCWDGQRLLPERWVKDVTTVSDVFLASADKSELTPNGAMWWVNQAVHDNPRPWPDAPGDTFLADGHWGQTIIVIPSEDVVIVRTGDDRDATMPFNDLVKLALPVAR